MENVSNKRNILQIIKETVGNSFGAVFRELASTEPDIDYDEEDKTTKADVQTIKAVQKQVAQEGELRGMAKESQENMTAAKNINIAESSQQKFVQKQTKKTEEIDREDR